MLQRMRKAQGFTIIELIGAMSIAVILLTCFYTTLRGLYSMQRVLEEETMAVVVMNNLVERLDAEGTRDTAAVSRIFKEEYEKSPVSQTGKLTPECRTGDGVISVRILKKNGKPLAKLELKQ